MRILGLTGGIAMGKSAAARAMRRLGLPVHDADALVHGLYARGGAAVPAVAAAFPQAVVDGAVDRAHLGAWVLGQPALLRKLEGIVHPLVRQATRRWLAVQGRQRRRLVVLDIPLLYETGDNELCDAVMAVTAPAFLQRQRALRRPGVTPDKLKAILVRQLDDRLRLRRADYAVVAGLSKAVTLRHLKRIARVERCRCGGLWSASFGSKISR
ncbi:MAG: dephospho-CoA kinase [Rhodospirillales bacterium]|nr:dephospho-CoA kinase [Rhodospirillales bacterium]